MLPFFGRCVRMGVTFCNAVSNFVACMSRNHIYRERCLKNFIFFLPINVRNYVNPCNVCIRNNILSKNGVVMLFSNPYRHTLVIYINKRNFILPIHINRTHFVSVINIPCILMLGTVLICNKVVKVVTDKPICTLVIEIAESTVLTDNECKEGRFNADFSVFLVCCNCFFSMYN